MKKIILSIVFLLLKISFAQIDVAQPEMLNENFYINELIRKISFAIKNKNEELLNKLTYTLNSERSVYYPEKISDLETYLDNNNFDDIKIILNSIPKLTVNTATVSISFYLFSEIEIKSCELEVELIKENNNWYIKADQKVNDFLKKLIIKKLTQRENNTLESFQIRMSNSTLIQEKYSHSYDIWEVNKTLTMSRLQRGLFANDSELDTELYWFGNNPDNWLNETAVFVLDPVWQRIVYAKGSSSNIKSYGDNLNDYKFSYPLALTMDESGLIYVADTGNKKIVILSYNPSTNQITLVGSYNIPMLKQPKDIIYTRGTNEQGKFWIIDGPAGPLILINKNGQVLNIIDKYKYNGIVHDFNNPSRIVCHKGSEMPMLIDPDSRILMCGWIYDGDPNIFQAITITQFPQTSIITDVGLDCLGEPIVTDSYNHMIHKLTWSGEYVCSFNYSSYRTQAFRYPQRVSSFNFNKPGWVIMQNQISDLWNESFGLKNYLQGADVLNLDYNQMLNGSHNFTFLASNACKASVVIYQNNTSIDSVYRFWTDAGLNTFVFNNNALPIATNLKYRVYYRPFYDDKYKSNKQGWKSKEITFSTLKAPIISGFTQDPIPIYSGETGTVTCDLSQGNGNISYEWAHYDKPDNVSITFQGNIAIIHNSERYSGSTIKNEITAPAFMLTCTASNILGSSSDSYYPILSSSPGYGCPILAFDSNSSFIDENPLLITSLSNPGIDVTDYYLINTSIQPENGKIKLVIHEPQTEHTYLDQVELFKFKIKKDEFTAVTDEGEFVTYKKPNKPYKITLNNKTDLTNVLSDLDGDKVELKEGDVLLIEKSPSLQEGEEEYIVIGGEKPPESQKKIAGRIKTIFQLKDLAKDIDKTVGEKELSLTLNNEFYLRPNVSVVCKKLNKSGNSIEITLSQKLNLDYLTIVKNLKTAKVSSLELISAMHNLSGEIKDKLLYQDNIYGEILPSESISFTFNDDNTPTEKSAFILKSVGRYTTIESKIKGIISKNILPTQMSVEFTLFQNSPNPFNPTTRIIYSIKEEGLVILKIFDLLGREVTTFVNEPKQPGEYEVEFNADKYGLTSGVYLYQLRSNGYTQTKKFVYVR